MKNNKNYLYLCIILSILLFLTGIYFNFKYHSSISSNPYAEESSIEYMVCLKENDFYKQTCLNEEKEYVASLTKDIRLTLKYNRIYSAKTNKTLKYYTATKMLIYNKDNNKEIYVDENNITEEKKYDGKNEVYTIFDDVIINFDNYKEIVDRYIQNYSINSKAELEVILYVKEEEQTNKVATLTIPISEQTYSIRKDLVKTKIEETVTPEAKNYLFISILLFVLAVILLAVTIYRKLKKTTETAFEMEVNKILSDYDRIIVESKGDDYNTRDKQLIELESFIELVDVRDTLEKPIVYIRKNDYTRDFVVQDNELVYRFRMIDNSK